MPYGYGYAFGLMTGGASLSGLSISAPSAVLFADGDQPISLYDYGAHNFVHFSEDFTNKTASFTDARDGLGWYWNNSELVVGTNTLQDNTNSAPDWLGFYNNTLVAGDVLRFSLDITKDAGYAATAMFQPGGDGQFNQLFFDPADGNYDYYTATGSLSDISVTDNTTYWTLEFTFGPLTGNLVALAMYPAWGGDETLTGSEVALDSYGLNSATETIEITRVWCRHLSSPATYVESTGTSAGATASYGDIQFADAQYDSGADSYKVTLSIGNGVDEGDMTLQTVAGLTFTPTTGGNGTADASMEFTGTLAACLAALRGISVDNVAPGAVDLDVLVTHPATGRTASKTIEIGSVAALSGGTVNNNIASGTTLENVTSLPGATYEIINYTPTLDEATPTVTLSPLDNATDVAVDVNMTMTFNQNVRFVVGGGTIVLREVGGSVLETFTPSSKTSAPGSAGGTCTITTTTVTINPNADLANSDEFEIIVSDGVIEDYNGNDYGGLATGEWSFTTVAAAAGVTAINAVFAETRNMSGSSPTTVTTSAITHTGDALLALFVWPATTTDNSTATLSSSGAMTELQTYSDDTFVFGTNRAYLAWFDGNVNGETISLNFDVLPGNTTVYVYLFDIDGTVTAFDASAYTANGFISSIPVNLTPGGSATMQAMCNVLTGARTISGLGDFTAATSASSLTVAAATESPPATANVTLSSGVVTTTFEFSVT